MWFFTSSHFAKCENILVSMLAKVEVRALKGVSLQFTSALLGPNLWLFKKNIMENLLNLEIAEYPSQLTMVHDEK